MKIIKVDNFARDYVDEVLIASDVPRFYAKVLVDFLNKEENRDYDAWYRAVPDDYVLEKFEA